MGTDNSPFKDHFSRQANIYAKFRPCYPTSLFARLASLSPGKNLAWDCGTGNGQAALSLTDFFDSVIATDASEQQIKNAAVHDKIIYRIEKAEHTGFPDASVDLITVANALHWFQLPAFYTEAARVLKPHGVIATWCYKQPLVSPAIDKIIKYFHDQTLGGYWLSENMLVTEEYRTLDFPFDEIQMPEFYCEKFMDLKDLIGYLNTWSAVQRFIQKNKFNPADDLAKALAGLWKDPQEKKSVRWKLFFRVGKHISANFN